MAIPSAMLVLSGLTISLPDALMGAALGETIAANRGLGYCPTMTPKINRTTSANLQPPGTVPIDFPSTFANQFVPR